MTPDFSDFKYHCPCCGEEKQGLPALAFATPYNYAPMPPAQTRRLGHKGADVYIDRVNRSQFVRCTLSLPIKGTEMTLEWGVWASLSQTNMSRYKKSFASDRQSRLGPMFGWFASNLPGYSDTSILKCMVHPQDDHLRPWIELEPTDHPLSIDFEEGITPERAIELATPWLKMFHH